MNEEMEAALNKSDRDRCWVDMRRTREPTKGQLPRTTAKRLRQLARMGRLAETIRLTVGLLREDVRVRSKTRDNERESFMATSIALILDQTIIEIERLK